MTLFYGESYSRDQACIDLLALIHSPVLGNTASDTSFGHTMQRVENAGLDNRLSSGEYSIYSIARSIWTGKLGADIADLGRIDGRTRRDVMQIVVFYYLQE